MKTTYLNYTHLVCLFSIPELWPNFIRNKFRIPACQHFKTNAQRIKNKCHSCFEIMAWIAAYFRITLLQMHNWHSDLFIFCHLRHICSKGISQHGSRGTHKIMTGFRAFCMSFHGHPVKPALINHFYHHLPSIAVTLPPSG